MSWLLWLKKLCLGIEVGNPEKAGAESGFYKRVCLENNPELHIHDSIYMLTLRFQNKRILSES